MPELRIDVPKPNTQGFERGFQRVFRILDRTERKIRDVDRASRRTGRGFGGGFRGGSGGGGGRGGRGSRQGGAPSGRKNIFGGQSGVSSGAANVARAGGIGGAGAIAIGSSPGVALAIAAVAAFAKATSEATKFEAKLGEVSRVAGLTESATASFGKSIESLSVELAIGTDELFKLASAGANAGLRANDLAAFTTEMAKLSALLPEVSTEQVRGIVRIATLTGFPVERIGELNNKLVDLQQNTKTTLPELINISQRVAQDAGIFGVTTDKVLALGAVIKDLGLQPERASTAIGKLIGKLKNLDSVSDDSLRRINATLRTPIDIRALQAEAVNDPIKAMQRLGAESNNLRKVLTELGVTGKQAVLSTALLQNIELFNRVLERSESSTDIIGDQLQQKLKESASVFKKFKEEAVAAMRNFGANILPVITTVIEHISRMWKGFKRLVHISQELLSLDFKGALEVFDGTREAKRIERVSDAISEARLKVAKLQAEGKQILAGAEKAGEAGILAVAPQIKIIDDQIVDEQKKLENFLTANGVFGTELQKALKQVLTLTAKFKLVQKAKAGKAAFDRLGAAIGKSNDKAAELAKQVDNLKFEISLDGLESVDADIKRVIRNINKEFTELSGTDIINAAQRDNAIKNIENILSATSGSLFLENKIDLSGDAATIVSDLENLISDGIGVFKDEDIQFLRQAQQEAERISISDKNVALLRQKRNLELDRLLKQELKNIKEERANIAQKSAPALEAILDSGAALEILNQRQLDTALQNEELAELEQIKEAVQEQIRIEKNKKIKVLDRPPGT